MHVICRRLAPLLLLFFSLGVSAETVRIATGDYPPWTSSELPEGGFINMLVTKAFHEVGIDVEYDYIPWKRALEATRIGQYHASSFWGHDPVRDTDFVLSEPIHYDPIVLAHPKDLEFPNWQLLEQLEGFVFGATRGYTYSEGFWKLIDSDVLRVSVSNTDVENLEKLVAGQIDFFPISKATGRYLLHKYFTQAEADTIAFHSKPVNSSLDFLLFPRHHEETPALLEKFNRGLTLLREKTSVHELEQAYIKRCCEF